MRRAIRLALPILHSTGHLTRAMSFPMFRRLIGSGGCREAWQRLGAQIDDTAFISTSVWMRGPHNIAIGAGCKLAGAVLLDSWERITIEANVLINDADLLTAGHDIDSPFLDGVRKPIRIGEYAWIIRGVTILPGVQVGRYAVLGTCAVVTRDVPDYAVVAGNPARVIRERAHTPFSYVPSDSDWRRQAKEADGGIDILRSTNS
jgi:putative colanic acid biosynthesis acetyltransferase WcaF